jgi:hypothetical protein
MYRNHVNLSFFYIGPKETLALSFPGEGRLLMKGCYVEVHCLEGGPVLVSVNGHLECLRNFKWIEASRPIRRIISVISVVYIRYTY